MNGSILLSRCEEHLQDVVQFLDLLHWVCLASFAGAGVLLLW